MGVFEKHIGKGHEVVLGGDTFVLKYLTIEELPLFFSVMKGFSGAEGKSGAEAFKNMTDETSTALKLMIDKTLEKSYPDESEEERKQFAMKFLFPLMEAIMEMNTANASKKEIKKFDRNGGVKP